MQLAARLLKGLIGGAAIGLLIGVYVVFVSKSYVIRPKEYSHPINLGYAEDRFTQTVITAFVVTFAYFGALTSNGNFGPWVRHSLYGFLLCFIVAVIVAHVAAAVKNEYPFSQEPFSSQRSLGLGYVYGFPCSLLLGPILGTTAGALVARFRKSSSGPTGEAISSTEPPNTESNRRDDR